MAKTIAKWSGIALILAILAGGGWVSLNWKQIRGLQELNSAWYAQNMCACVFVTGRKEDACRDYVRQILPVKSIEVDRKKKQVTATATIISFWSVNTSHYEGPRHGCRLRKK